ncbi:MAG: hypothetical protein ACQ9CV_04795 [Nitrosopumilus sp.]
MPHIALDKKIDLFEFAKFFSPVFQKSPIIKISTIYVEKNGLNALLPAVVIDEKHQEYFIQILTTENKTTIRLLPITDPEKTDSVKSSLAQVYFLIKQFDSQANISKSNLWDYVKSDAAS